MSTAIKTTVIVELRSDMLGDVIERSNPGYAEARAIWNGHVTRQPA